MNFKDHLFQSALYGIAKTLGPHAPDQYGDKLHQAGQAMIGYLQDQGYAHQETGSPQEMAQLVDQFLADQGPLLGLAPETAQSQAAAIQELHQEIAALKEAEQTALKEKEYYRTIFDSAADAIFLPDPDTGRIIDCNQNAYKSLGYTREELLGMPVSEFNVPIPNIDIKNYLERQVAGEQMTFEVIHLSKAGEQIPVEIVGCKVNLHGKLATLAYARDISDRKKLEQKILERTEQLAQANDTKDKFFSIISHDLRGPVGSISMLFNEVFEQGSDISDDLFQSIAQASKNTQMLLENLLSWAQSQQGEIEYHPKDFQIAASLKGNMDLFYGIAQQKQIRLSDSLDWGLYAHADVDMVTTIIRNLINNAVKFTPPEGEIKVSASQQGDWVRVEVTDSGVGMPEEIQASLFRLDQKTHSSLGTNSESGSGLGLILCAEFVKRNGGEIGATSQEGQGSCFWFTVPLGQRAEALSPEAELNGLARLAEMQILLVDDNQLHLESSGSVLKELGLSFETAVNGAEGVQKYQARRPDILLMDIDMPVMNGVEANLAIRAAAGQSPPLIVALTSYSKKELTQLAHEVPFDGYLNKPLDKAKLIASLQPYLDHR